MQLHSEERTELQFPLKTIQCTFCSPAALGHEGQMEPHGHICSRKHDADRSISARRKGPFERYADVVQFSNIGSHAFGDRSQRQHGLGWRNEVSKELRMTSRGLLSFTAFGLFLERVRSYGFEQPPTGRGCRCIHG